MSKDNSDNIVHPNDQLLSDFDQDEKHVLNLTPEVGVPLFARLKKFLINKDLFKDDEETKAIKEIEIARGFYCVHVDKYGEGNFEGGSVETGEYEITDGQVYFDEFLREANLLVTQMNVTNVRLDEVFIMAVSETYFVISYGDDIDKENRS